MEARNINDFYLTITINGENYKFQHGDENFATFIESISSNTNFTEFSIKLGHVSGETVGFTPFLDPDDEPEDGYLFNSETTLVV